MYLLDTNVLSELRKRDRGHPTVQAWIDQVSSDDLWISVLLIGEIRKGINILQRRDPASASTLEIWLEETMEDFEGKILPITLKPKAFSKKARPAAESL